MSGDDSTLLVELADEAWRLARRVERLERSAGADAVRGVADSAARLRDILERGGVTTEEHTGQAYDERLGLEVVHVRGQPGEGDPLWVVDTIRPSVRLAGVLVRPSHVILSTEAPGEASE
jgi:hypothetical protein